VVSDLSTLHVIMSLKSTKTCVKTRLCAELVIQRQVAGYAATLRQATQCSSMTQALRHNVQLRTAAECQQSLQMLVGLHYPESNMQHD